MNISVHVGPEDLGEFAQRCATDLFAGVQHEFLYPGRCSLDHWPVAEIKKANEPFLKSLRGRANVYALYLRRPKSDEWRPVYVGQRKSVEMRQRLTAHLICKNPGTGSMLEAVKTAVASGESVAISLILVRPDSLRLFVEETIIATHKSRLPWNTHG
jgi:hypothetical protein